jgi:hypothetical protein
MKKYTYLLLLISVFSTFVFGGEASAKKEKVESKKEKVTEKARIEDSLGFTAPYIPVLLPPTVKKVWIPPHVSDADPDVMIGGHWIFIKVTDDKWFIETENQENMNFPILVPTSGENKQ